MAKGPLTPAELQARRDAAFQFRFKAAVKARTRRAKEHRDNGDEDAYADDNYAMSFTKGLKHKAATLLVDDSQDVKKFRDAMDKGKVEDFNAISRPSDRKRQWEAPTAGFVHDLEGPDAQEVTMAPAPKLGSDELTYEMAEVYELALLRDVSFDFFRTAPFGETAGRAPEPCAETPGCSGEFKPIEPVLSEEDGKGAIAEAIDRMNDLAANFNNPSHSFGHRRRTISEGGKLDAQTIFRGSSPKVDVGGYLSQFMLMGNGELGGCGRDETAGQVRYGVQLIDQRVPVAAQKRDYMGDEDSYLAVQNGRRPDPQDQADADYDSCARRFVTTPRDLATYVHFDALYQAYLNACLILLDQGAPFDPKFDLLSGMGKYKNANTGGFALWGGPHILSLVTEVATRGLKAVRFQKFNTHFRLRPEALAARVHKAGNLPNNNDLRTKAKTMSEQLNANGLLTAISAHNNANNYDDKGPKNSSTCLLPMAFREGSPMHPAYGAGHATVAGACVTVLKAFFDTNAVLKEFVDPNDPSKRKTAFTNAKHKKGDEFVEYRVIKNGAALEKTYVDEKHALTLEGELNKLAANISIGRNMAGVHYYSDYFDSVRMGEEIAIGIMQEQALGYPKNKFKMTLNTFDGNARTIV